MRLTFRRLLAYLDGILDEQDAEVLGQKIAESDFATRLIHRIRNAKTRLRLGAPRLSGKGMGLDPNTVAEYLDYTLDEDRVADFEKVCLESDVHLAEVASSHEILTIVLAEPAQVERSIRERMYGLPNELRGRQRELRDGTQVRTDAAHSESTAPPAAAEAEAEAMREVNELLHDRKELRLRSLLLTVALTFLLVLVGLRAVGPFDSNHPVIGGFFDEASLATGPSPAELRKSDLRSPNPSDPRAEDVTPVPLEPGAPPVPLEPGAPPVPLEPAAPPAPVPLDPSAPPAPLEPAVPPAPAPLEPGAPPAPAPLEPGAPPPLEPGAPPPLEPGASPPAPEPGTAPAPVEPGSPPPPKPDGAGPAPGGTTDDPATEGIDVGRFTSENSVLTRYDKTTKTWRRLPSRGIIRSGDRLMAPPVFRPQLALTSGIQLIIVGPSELRMLPPRDGKPVVQVVYGQILVETVATSGAEADFDLAGQQGKIVLQSVDSSVAMEVDWYSPVGSDPQRGAEAVVRWSALRGEVKWLTDVEAGATLAAGESITAVGDKVMAPAAMPPPAWADLGKLDGIPLLDYRNATRELEPEFSPDRAASLTLQELLNHRMVDVQSLAARSLTHLNNFRPFVQSLRTVKKRSYWEAEYLAIEKALSRGATAAAALRDALEAEFPGEPRVVELLYELCVSYDNEQLEAGAAAKLVDNLSHAEMAVRVLASENLKLMTGKTRLYSPEKLPDQQKTMIRDWTTALNEGSIKWAQIPQPLAPGP